MNHIKKYIDKTLAFLSKAKAYLPQIFQIFGLLMLVINIVFFLFALFNGSAGILLAINAMANGCIILALGFITEHFAAPGAKKEQSAPKPTLPSQIPEILPEHPSSPTRYYAGREGEEGYYEEEKPEAPRTYRRNV